MVCHKNGSVVISSNSCFLTSNSSLRTVSNSYGQLPNGSVGISSNNRCLPPNGSLRMSSNSYDKLPNGSVGMSSRLPAVPTKCSFMTPGREKGTSV